MPLAPLACDIPESNLRAWRLFTQKRNYMTTISQTLETPEAVHTVTAKLSFERVAQECGPMINRIASSHETDRQQVQELVQDMLFAVWQALPSFRGDAPIRAFVARIATNRAVTHIRQALRRGQTVELSIDIPALDTGPEERAIALDEQSRLLRAVRSLPLAYRQVALLILEGFSAAEVAGVLGISANAVSIRMSRAKDLLRERIGANP
jgi:RNA polymerase sigma-70 factor (ECF subfamily)